MASTAPQDLGTPFLLEDYIAVILPVTTDSPPLCAVCHSSASPLRCSICKNIHYCTPTCQKFDWPSHKLLCKHFTSQSHKNTRPTLSHRRALYLPDESEKPWFIWLQHGEDGHPLDKRKCFPGTSAEEVKTIAFHNRYLPTWTQISYASNPHNRSLPFNKTVERLLSTAARPANAPSTSTSASATSSGMIPPRAVMWRGPLVVIAYSAEEGLSRPALDVDTRVLGPVVEYLRLRREYGGPVFVEQPQEWLGEGEWRKVLGGDGKE